MLKKGKEKPGYARLLDAWEPPDGAGDPVGCLATTFTFDSAFFEEECLGRFLDMNFSPEEANESRLYIIEREEKLGQLTCAAVLADQKYCRGLRSLGWDLLMARLPNQKKLHAKLSILRWSRLIRIIVGSANLTPEGYRKNLEIFSTLDYTQDNTLNLECLIQGLGFMDEAITYAQLPGSTEQPDIARWKRFVLETRKQAKIWGAKTKADDSKHSKVFPIFTGTGRGSVIKQMIDLWPESNPPEKAWVMSPFFDPPAVTNKPTQEVWKALKKRGSAELSIYTSGEKEGDGTLRLNVPKSVLAAEPMGRPGVITRFYQIENENKEEQALRLLHAKVLSFSNDRWLLFLLGSSNFTSAGLGLRNSANLEANLAYLIDSRKSKKEYRQLLDYFMNGKYLDSQKILWLEDIAEIEKQETLAGIALHPFFGSVILEKDDQANLVLHFYFVRESPACWSIDFTELDSTDLKVLTETEWSGKGRPGELIIPWLHKNYPSGFKVTWQNSGGEAWWPVNVQDKNVLPPPEELRDLSLDTLIEIISSAGSWYQIINLMKRKKHRGATDQNINDLDPLNRFDASGYILQRTRRLSRALQQLKERLGRPVVSLDSLEWRLKGPVGARALVEAIKREIRNPEEQCFLIAELCLDLSRVEPQEAEGTLKAQVVKSVIRDFIEEITRGLNLDSIQTNKGLLTYINEAFQRIVA